MTNFFIVLLGCLSAELIIYFLKKYRLKILSKILLKIVPSSNKNTRAFKNREYTLKDLDKSFWEED